MEISEEILLGNAPEIFELPVYKKPLVSIVIPVYNQYVLTHACVYSILKRTPSSIPYEVVILDDCSTDETQRIKEHIKNIKVCRNQENKGFLRNCNAYISKVQGKYVFLLNNDTEVAEGWLEPAIKALKERGVGVLTSCVLNQDGTIQGAGLSIKPGGNHFVNYYGLSPKYLKNKVMDVHTVYGCAMCFKKSLWIKLNGFDELYALAYYEEMDFSMRVHYQLKKRVICVANSKVFHYGSMSYSKKGFELAKVNKEKFVNRWQKELDEDGVKEGTENQYLDDLWRWDIIRLWGVPVLKSYYKDSKKTYYLDRWKLFSKPFVYED